MRGLCPYRVIGSGAASVDALATSDRASRMQTWLWARWSASAWVRLAVSFYIFKIFLFAYSILLPQFRFILKQLCPHTCTLPVDGHEDGHVLALLFRGEGGGISFDFHGL